MASQLDGHEFEQAPGDSEGQGRLACCSSWDQKESDMTEQQNNKLLLGHCLNIVWNSVKISGNVIDFTDTEELTAESLSHFKGSYRNFTGVWKYPAARDFCQDPSYK